MSFFQNREVLSILEKTQDYWTIDLFGCYYHKVSSLK